MKAEIGDYILVINPRPDSIDHHHLNAIEMVASVEVNGVISNNSNGIKHNEYWVMVPRLEEGATLIDYQVAQSQDNLELKETEELEQTESTLPKTYMPRIGNIYQRKDKEPTIQTMIIAIKGHTIYLGGGFEVTKDELADNENGAMFKTP